MSYSAIQESLKPIDRVTLYRTLESLKEKGKFIKLSRQKRVFYAMCEVLAEDQHRHEHVHLNAINVM